MKDKLDKQRRPRVAIIGCGLQVELSQLPAIAESDTAEVVLLVDKVLPIAQRLAEKYQVAAATDDYRQAIGKADAALIALPNYLHAPVATDLLRQGIDVLVEKPMAMNSKQCDEMIEAADSRQSVLGVGLDFRFPKSARFAHQAVNDGLLGNLLNFDFRMGNDLTTLSFKSDYLLRKQTAGGGTLIDLGVHALDLMLWWLGDYQRIDYYDDAMGGVEANCELHVQLRSGVSGIIEVSRTRTLRNTCIIQGERGTLEVGIWNLMGLLKLNLRGQPITLSAIGSETSEPWRDWRNVFRSQFEDFIAAVRKREDPFVSGREGKRSIELIDDCYAARQLLPQPWLFPLMADRCDLLASRRDDVQVIS